MANLGYLLNVNATSNSGDTALHIASRLGFVDLVDTLLENGASVVKTLSILAQNL